MPAVASAASAGSHRCLQAITAAFLDEVVVVMRCCCASSRKGMDGTQNAGSISLQAPHYLNHLVALTDHHVTCSWVTVIKQNCREAK